MKSTYLLMACAAMLTTLPAQAGRKAAKHKQNPSKPNVLLIVADDLGYGDLECYGDRYAPTPNVNRLADEGVRFTNMHAVASTSTPSRYSLLTGHYAWRRDDTQVAPGNAGMIIRPQQYTLADMMRNSGYRTGAIGKWHLGLGDKTGEQDWNAPLPSGLRDIGFDYYYIMAATADRVPCVFIENDTVVNYDPQAPIFVNYHHNFDGEPTGRDNPELLFNQKASHGHDFSIVNGIGRIGYMKGGGKALWKDENIADSIAAHSVRFIEESAAAGEPFFLYMATNDVHVPRFPHERFRGKNPMGVRGDAIEQFDWTVGQVMATIDRLGIADNTIVILTSDNGPVVDDGYADRAKELLGDHKPSGPFRGYKYSAFEGGTAVPAIVRWPGKVDRGQVSDALMSHIDFMASLSNLTGSRLPKGAAPDSRDMLQALLGRDKAGAPWVIEHSGQLCVRTPEWKYIEADDGPAMIQWGPKIETGNLHVPQLYDMTAGEWEGVNKADEHPEVVYRMQEIIRKVRNNQADRIK